MKKTLKANILVLILLYLVFVVVLLRLDLSKTLHALVSVRWWWVVCAALMNITNTWVEAARWKLILSSIKKEIRHRIAFAAILVGVVGNVLLPLRIGDGARAYYISKKEGIYLASAISSMVLDRMVDITFFLVLVAITAWFFHFQWPIMHVVFLALTALGCSLIVLMILVRFGHHFMPKFKGKLGQMVSEQVKRFVMGLSALRDTSTLLPTSILSVISWGMRLAIIWSMFNAFHLDLMLIAVAVTLILINLGIAVVNAPANLGVFELSAVGALRLFSVKTEVAVSYAVVLHLVEVVPIVLMGLLVIWLSGFRLGSFQGFRNFAKNENAKEWKVTKDLT